MPEDGLEPLIRFIKKPSVPAKQALFRSETADESEYMVLSGALRSFVINAEGEYTLAALSGKACIEKFRQIFPDMEQRAPHPMIASYLGMSAVSLSRLRGQQPSGRR